MARIRVELTSGTGKQTLETDANDIELRFIKDLERSFKIARWSSTQPILEVLTLQEDRPEPGNLFDLRPNTP